MIAVPGLGCDNRSGQERSAVRASLSAGMPAPEFVLRDLQGKEHSLAQYRGKVVLLHFWATWCSPCVVEIPALERLARRYRGEGLEVVAVSVDSAAAKAVVQKFLNDHGLSFDVLLDPQAGVAPQYGVTGFPESFFIDREGRLLSFSDPLIGMQEVRIISERPWDLPAYVEAVGRLLVER